MEKIIEFMLVIGIGTLYFAGISIIAMLVQLISYRVFKFNIYKKVKILMEREVK